MTRCQSNNGAPQTQPSQSIARVHTSNFRIYVSKRRWWLGIGAILVFIAMVIGIVFAAHNYYVILGGQGFLKVRGLNPEHTLLNTPKLFLPLRRIEFKGKEATALGVNSRSPANVPFYACGDQLHSCEAYNHPNICCPVKTFCHPSRFTKSKIFCCNSTSASDCHTSKVYPPTCLQNTFQCSEETSGGCCPHGTICAPNGCIEIIGPSIISDLSTAKPTSSSDSYISTIVNGNAADGSRNPISTVTERPAATITSVKQGEVAQSGVPQKGAVVLTLSLPYISTWILACVAALMGFL